MKTKEVALTFDDIVILPGYYKEDTKFDISTTLCKDRHGRDLILEKPFFSAAMDTITEKKMAIIMAREGSMGVIHANLTPEEQAKQVKAVKRAENLMISKPICVYETTTIKETAELMQEAGFSSIPVLDKEKKILGLAVRPSIRFQEDDFEKCITTTMVKNPVIVKLSEVQDEKIGCINLEKAKSIFAKNTQHNTKALLVADENNVLIGMITSKDVENLKTFPNACKDIKGRLRVAAAISTAPNFMERVHLLVHAEVDMLVIDSSQGHSDYVANAVRSIKKEYSSLPVVAGNVVTSEGALFLAEAGADIIKVGVGPGAICSTRKISGVGLSQFSAVLEVCEALQNDYPHIAVIADGGIKYTGDIGKAIVAGAKAIMMGNVFSGTDEAPGDIIIHEGSKVKVYRGMGSIDAMKKGSGSRYEQDGKELISHGIVSYVPYKGSVTDVIIQYAGGLRETMKLTGATNLAELKKAQWRQITNAGEKESHPHNVTLAHDEPNYKK